MLLLHAVVHANMQFWEHLQLIGLELTYIWLGALQDKPFIEGASEQMCTSTSAGRPWLSKKDYQLKHAGTSQNTRELREFWTQPSRSNKVLFLVPSAWKQKQEIVLILTKQNWCLAIAPIHYSLYTLADSPVETNQNMVPIQALWTCIDIICLISFLYIAVHVLDLIGEGLTVGGAFEFL